MRSRYSAYALSLPDYIMDTTSVQRSRSEWRQEILDFCKKTRFENLEILNFTSGTLIADVTFIAHLKQGDHDASFKEESHFIKVDGRWLYRNGEIDRYGK